MSNANTGKPIEAHCLFSGVAGLRFITFIWKVTKQKNNLNNPVDPVQKAINEIKNKIIWLPGLLAFGPCGFPAF